MTRTRTLAPLVAALVLASGCGIFKTEEQQRAERTRERPLEMPPDLTTPAADERFAIPDPRASTSLSQYNRDRAGAPQGTTVQKTGGVLPTVENARLVRAGDQRWIVAKADPASVWPLVREFWIDNGFGLARETPEAGIMETTWRDARAKIETGGVRGFMDRYLPGMYATSERDRFRTRIERGAEAGTTEIYVSHRGYEEVYTSSLQEQTRWQPRGTGTDRDLEAEMLGRLLVKLGSPAPAPAAGTATAAAPATPAAPGSKPPPAPIVAAPAPSANALLENAGAGPLVVNDGFERAWRRVGLALDRVGFTVEDRDRTKGTYFVRYIDPDAQTSAGSDSWTDKLAFWRAAPKTAQPQYRIQLADTGAGLTTVVVQNAKGEPENTPTGKRILALLFEQLK
jgi:outer membrane protein assembly factor BamC